MKKTLAPNWVMMGILALVILNAIPGIIMSLDLVTPESVSFSEERVWAGSYSYLKGGWIMKAISLVYFATIALLCIIRKWRPAVLIGSILLMVNAGTGFWIEQNYISATNLEELRNAFEIAGVVNPVNIVLYIVGNLMIAFYSAIPQNTKISFAILIGIGFLLSFIPLPTGEPICKFWFNAARPIFAAVLIYFCFTSESTQQTAQ